VRAVCPIGGIAATADRDHDHDGVAIIAAYAQVPRQQRRRRVGALFTAYASSHHHITILHTTILASHAAIQGRQCGRA
jgi:hypothetical protein